MAAKLIKLKFLYEPMGRRIVARTIFFTMALAAMPILYAVQDPSPCHSSDNPDDCIVNFRSNPKLLFRAASLLSFSNNHNPNKVSKVDSLYKPRPSGGLGIEFHSQKRIWANKAWRQKVEFYSAIFQKLSERGFLRPGSKALCVGKVSKVDSLYKPRPSGGLGIEFHSQKRIWANKAWRQKVEFYSAIFQKLSERGFLRPGSKALCVEAGSGHCVLALRENGLPDAIGIDPKSFAPLARKGYIHRLPFAHDSFDIVFSGSFDRAVVPALLASEVERTLKTGGVGVMLVRPRRLNVGNDINPLYSLNPVVALFRNSDVVHVIPVGPPTAHHATVIALRKRPLGSSKPSGLVQEYPCSKQNRSVVKLAEHLTKDHGNAIYLPTLKDISASKRHIYVEIGGNNSSNSIDADADADSGWFRTSYPKQNQSFDIYVFTGLVPVAPESLNSIKQVVGDDAKLSRSNEFVTAGLDIAGWLSEMSVSDDDFVVVKMGFEHVTGDMIRDMINMSGTGFMCLIDELFLQCSSSSSHYSDTLLEEVNGECLKFLQSLRDHGVFAHRW